MLSYKKCYIMCDVWRWQSKKYPWCHINHVLGSCLETGDLKRFDWTVQLIYSWELICPGVLCEITCVLFHLDIRFLRNPSLELPPSRPHHGCILFQNLDDCFFIFYALPSHCRRLAFARICLSYNYARGRPVHPRGYLGMIDAQRMRYILFSVVN